MIRPGERTLRLMLAPIAADLADDTTTEIVIQRPGEVGVERRSGWTWRDVPERYGNWNSVYRRFRRWSASGVWEAVSTGLADVMGDAAHHSIDSTTVRAHVSAAGAKKGAMDRLLAARGAGGPVSFTASPTPGDARSRST